MLTINYLRVINCENDTAKTTDSHRNITKALTPIIINLNKPPMMKKYTSADNSFDGPCCHRKLAKN